MILHLDTPSEKLPRSRVIRRRSVFEATRAKGKRTSDRWMTLSVLPYQKTSGPASPQVAFLTPKRLGTAVVRNRLRRRMREIFRRELQMSSAQVFLVWIARPPAPDLPFPELRACMMALMVRAGQFPGI